MLQALDDAEFRRRFNANSPERMRGRDNTASGTVF